MPIAPQLDEIPVTTLLVEDDTDLSISLTRFLKTLGHEVLTATSAADAMDLVRRRKISSVLLDVRLPDTSGVDLVPQLIAIEPHLAVLMMTAVNDAHAAALCMQRGAMDYLVKPVDLQDLERAIARALARRREHMEQEQTQAWLKSEIVLRGAELRRERSILERVSVATLEALVNALEAKDAYLRGHSTRIADLAAQVAAELDLTDEAVELVRTAGRLHDIGKIGIREEVLHKQGPLTPDEFDHVKTHVVIGSQILAPLTHLREVIAFVRSHHERVDGTGYPDALAGDAIPLGARILCATEVFDALTTPRPYQSAMEPADAARRMRDLVGTVIDARVQDALERVVQRKQRLVFIDEQE